ncbi:MAG: hypothetical protein IT577_18120 [Verrucomicrobiae bacterium]|nr:hypothetical protein [Verrucomicrobiae bacterium]
MRDGRNGDGGPPRVAAGNAILSEDGPYSLIFWLEHFQDDGDWPAVMRTARELLHLAPEHPEGLRFLAEAYFRLEKWEEAHEVACRLVRAHPFVIDGYWVLSDLAARADDLERSADYIERAARLIPNSDAIWVEAARANFNLGRLGRCLMAADHGLRVNPMNIRLIIYRVFALVGLRCEKGAKIAAGRLLDLGVDADVLRETARELGITGASVARLERIAGGQMAELPAGSEAGSRRRARRALAGGAAALEEMSSQAPPLTRAQFSAQLAAAEERRAEVEESSGEDAGSDADGVADAEEVYYVFDRYRTHGPFTIGRLVRLFKESTFEIREAYVRREADDRWTRALEMEGLATAPF